MMQWLPVLSSNDDMKQSSDKLKLATVILAAGESKRMQGIKQLLPWKKGTLLDHAISQSLESVADAVFVVLGAHQKIILEATETSAVTVVHNPNWQLGMGTSIAAALTYFEEKQFMFDAVLVRLIDQPLLDVNYYNKLINYYIDKNKIIASSYENGFGVPAVFDKRYFSKLSDLTSDKGAKELIKANTKDLFILNSKGATLDMDTREVYSTYFDKYGK